MHRSTPFRREQGYVLVIGMIFLLVLMVGAVSLMTSTAQDEKMSGNSRRSADAFMASEAGVEGTLTELWERQQGQDYNPPEWFYYSCDDNALTDSDGNDIAAGTGIEIFPLTDYGSHGSQYRVNYGGMCEIDADGILQISFVSEGVQNNSLRRIHFNVSYNGDASWPAVFVNEDPDNPQCSFDFGPSNAYKYDGKGGPAISTNTSVCADAIRDADDGSGQLAGGVIANNPAPGFTEPEGLRKFYKVLKNSTRTQNIYPSAPKNSNKGVEPIDLNSPDFNHVNLGEPGDPADTTDFGDMEVVIVHGDLDMKGSLDGSGVLIVTGDATFSGTPNWNGLILVLGGDVDIGGGGTTDGLSGSLIVSNVDFGGFEYCDEDGNCQDDEEKGSFYAPSPDTEKWEFAGTPEIHWDVNGGGTARYSYSCEFLMKVDSFLTDKDGANIDEADSFPGPEDCSAVGDDGTFGTLYVFDWYEEVE